MHLLIKPIRLFVKLVVAVASALPVLSFALTLSVVRPAELRKDHYLDAPVVAKLTQGQRVELIEVNAGWVRVKTSTATGWVRTMFLNGAVGAQISDVSKLEAGKSSKLKKVSTTGIRSVAHASRHALIIGVGEYSVSGITSLPGVKYDVQSATQIAVAMGIAEGNITYLRDSDATAENIRQALSAIEKRIQQGDRVFVYFSGHGTRWVDFQTDPNACTEALYASDGQVLTNREMSSLLKPISSKADKLMVFYDACHSGGVVNQPLLTRSLQTKTSSLIPKFSGQLSSKICAKPSNMKTRSLSGELGRLGAIAENTVFIGSSRPDEVSFDDSLTGGLATVAWRDCYLGKAADLDQSGAISVEEVTQCAQTTLNEKLSLQPDILGQKMVIGGNRQFVPAYTIPNGLSSEELEVQRLAALKANKDAADRANLQALRAQAQAEALEQEAARQREAAERQQVELSKARADAEKVRLRAESLALEKERQRVEIERAQAELAKANLEAQKARLRVDTLAAEKERQSVASARIAQEMERVNADAEKARDALADRVSVNEQQRLQAQRLDESMAKVKAEAEETKLKADALAKEKERQSAESDRLSAELTAAKREVQRVQTQANALELENESQLLDSQRVAAELSKLEAQTARLESDEQKLAASQQLTLVQQATQTDSATPSSLSMEPSIPAASTSKIKPAGLLEELYRQRDASRNIEVTTSKQVLLIDKDPLELTVTSPVDGFLYLALAGSDEKSLYLLFPNKIDGNNRIYANKQIKLPRPTWRITAGGPAGVDTVLIMVSDSPRDLSALDGETAGPFVMPLMTSDGRSQLQSLLGISGNADQTACQVGGQTRNLNVQAVCSDSYAARLITFEER
jgi:hypothetical protein